MFRIFTSHHEFLYIFMATYLFGYFMESGFGHVYYHREGFVITGLSFQYYLRISCNKKYWDWLPVT